MAYKYCYQLQGAPTGTTDGAYIVSHDIRALYMDENETDWEAYGQEVPGNRKNFNLPTDDVETVMAMPDSTGPEKQAKNKAYKDLLEANINTMPVPVTGWDEATMNLKVTNNDASAAAAADVNEYITDTLGQSYPVEFQLDI